MSYHRVSGFLKVFVNCPYTHQGSWLFPRTSSFFLRHFFKSPIYDIVFKDTLWPNTLPRV